MDGQIVFESVGGARGETSGIVNKQVLEIELSLARQPTRNKDKAWFGLKELGRLRSVRACMCACTCVSACVHACVQRWLFSFRGAED